MKNWIHPTIYNTKVTCSCWAKFDLKTTMKTMKVETCKQCHSFFTWEKREDNRASRVARFRQKQKVAQDKKSD